MNKQQSQVAKAKAIELYETGLNPREIGERLGVPRRTVQFWVQNDLPAAISIHTPQIDRVIKDGTVIVISDNHIIPHQEYSVAARAALLLTKELKPKLVINNGDLFDFASISKHEKLGWQPQFTVKEELEVGVEFLRLLLKASPSSEFIALDGNHDTRFNKILANKLPQFKGVKGFDLRDQLPAGWRYTISIMINGNTIVLHSWHGGQAGSLSNTVKSGMSMICGHTHLLRIDAHTDYNGTRYGIQTGTLATIKNNPLFAYTNGTPLNWQSGFIVLTYVNGELQYPEPCVINNNNQAFFRGMILNV